MSEEATTKRPRGNPNLQKRKQEQSQQTQSKMSDDKKESTAEESTETTTAPQEPASEAKPTDSLPADLFSDKVPQSENIMLDGVVKVKDYAALPQEGATAAPSAEGSTPASTVGAAEGPGAAPVAPLTTEEQQNQAKQTVDLMLKGYEKLHALGRWVGKMDVTDLSALHAKGDIDLNQPLPLGNRTTSVGGFFEDYNKGIDENIIVTDEFKDSIRPPLTRIVIKNKLFMSDELYVAMIVAEDLTTKTSMLLGLRKSANMVLAAVKAMTAANNAAAKKTTTPPPVAEEVPYTEEPPGAGWREPEGTDPQG